MYAKNAYAKSARACMTADAHSERVVDNFHVREIFLETLLPGGEFLLRHESFGHADFLKAFLFQRKKTGIHIVLYCFAHGAESGLHSPYFGKSIQLVALNSKNGLQI